jgi:hypothetical protein
MRIRQIKPGYWKNVGLGEVSRDARLLFIGLWSIADCAGRMPDQPKRIKAEIFPYDDLSTEEVDSLLTELATHEESFIQRYESEGKKYIQVSNFKQHQHLMGNELKQTSQYPEPSNSKEYVPVRTNEYSVPISTTDIRSNGDTETRSNGSVSESVCEFQKKAIAYAQAVARNSLTNQNIGWVAPYVEVAFPEQKKVNPNIDDEGILHCWREAYDAAESKSKGDKYLKATFLNKVKEWKPQAVPKLKLVGPSKMEKLLQAKVIRNIWDNTVVEMALVDIPEFGFPTYNGLPIDLDEYVPFEEAM